MGGLNELRYVIKKAVELFIMDDEVTLKSINDDVGIVSCEENKGHYMFMWKHHIPFVGSYYQKDY